MRRALWILIFIVAAVPARGELASKLRVGLWPPVELPAEIITTIYSGRLTYPNSFVDTTGFDIVNAADDGSTIRYGYIRSSLPDNTYTDDYMMIVRGTSLERQNSTLPLYMGAVWHSLNGVKPGCRILTARTLVNSAVFSTNLMNDGAYVTCRVDTVAADYGVLDGVSTTSDACLFDMSYNNMDATAGSTPWDPPLADRDSWYHYGPRSESMIPGDVFGAAPGDSTGMTLIDAIQQIADRGQAAIDRGILVWYHSIGQTVNWQITCGDDATHVPNGGGNPALVITTSNRRGEKVWGNGKVPVMVMIDDLYPALPGYYGVLSGAGVDFDMVSPGNHWNHYTDCDSLHDAEYQNINFIAHGLNHTVLGGLTGATLNAEIAKESWITSANINAMPVAPDTTSMNIDFAWVGGAGTFSSIESLWKIPAHGYKSARGTNIKEFATCPVGDFTPMAWDRHSNLYTTTAFSLSGIFDTGGSPETDPEIIRERLLVFVDQMYTDYGRAAAAFFCHNLAIDKTTDENLQILETVIDDMFFLERVSYGETIDSMRARGFVDVADVVTANSDWATSFGDSVAKLRAFQTATRQYEYSYGDSTAVIPTPAEAVPMFDIMWVGPGGE